MGHDTIFHLRQSPHQRDPLLISRNVLLDTLVEASPSSVNGSPFSVSEIAGPGWLPDEQHAVGQGPLTVLNRLQETWLQGGPGGPNLCLPHEAISCSLPLTSVAMETDPLAGQRPGPTLCFLHLVREATLMYVRQSGE